ncbi:MAG: hypothetical protein PF961_20180 [Planctomycetota bacterium]|jgi:hypothetical protein|nr:hypothetical protein [Planctomycetota bacterium]
MSRLASLLLAVLSTTAMAAEPIVYEGFAYPSGRCEGNAGGLGWGGPWTDGHNGVQDASLVSAIGETPAATGGHFVSTNPDWAAKRALGTPIGTEAGTWYFSLLARNDTGVREENYGRVAFFGDQGDALSLEKGYHSSTWAIGGAKNLEGRVSAITTDAVFVVIKATWKADGTGSVAAFFDPELDTEPRVGDIGATDIAMKPISGVTIVGKKTFSFDEIRIGTSWAAVCPSP